MPNTIESVYPGLRGTIVTAHVYESVPTNVTNAIPHANAWGVQLKWELSGPFAAFLDLLGGFNLVDWELTLHLESIGAGGEHDITITPAWAPVAGAFEWTQNIPVAGNVVQIDAYKPVVTARLRLTPGGNVNPVGLPIYGFEELPMISIY